ncbi:MAG TPA: two-component regulator propeller domain-containing protein, partial [Puia sp.]|nr:two-component regulator propeller domain-containing protein [Puia sp.]
MKKNCCLAGIMVFLFCMHLRALAIGDPQVKHLGIEQGLSNNAVTCIYQDAKGFLWFGTYDGLNRYDGYGFTVYRNIIGDSASIPFNNVASINADQHDHIWVSGLKGIAILDPLTGKFAIPAYRSCDGHGIVKVQSFVHMIRSVGDRYVLAGSHSNGLLLFDGQSSVGWQIPLKELRGNQGSYDVFAVEYDKFTGRVWVLIQGKGLYALDLATKTLSPVNTTFRNGYSLKVDNNGTLWMGTDNGLFALSRDGRTFSANYYLPCKSRVVCIDVNSRNDLCFGTDGDGIWCLPANAAKAMPMLAATGASLVNSNAVYSVYEDREGRKWIGTLRG